MSTRITDGLDISDSEQVRMRARLLADMIETANEEIDKGSVSLIVYQTRKGEDRPRQIITDLGSELEISINTSTSSLSVYHTGVDVHVRDSKIMLTWFMHDYVVANFMFALTSGWVINKIDHIWVYLDDNTCMEIEDWYYDVWQPSQIEEDWSEVWEDEE